MATVLLVGLSQLLASAVSFLLNMQPHCLGLRQNALAPSFAALVTITGTVLELHLGGFAADWLLQEEIPLRFKVTLLNYMAICSVVLTVLMQTSWRSIAHCQACQTSSSGGNGSVNTEAAIILSAGHKFIFGHYAGHYATLRKTAPEDIGDWRTA